ncbi:hypothetical protein [Legionella cardiaca]|uniref:Ninein n=1 Tax=Legionella cardiaca TaxID=1071983 RepID=A0ABY8AXI9_9GAMM|nr:hypothetical protein [Legionella cardiaca]WED44446.1 hypothetical protein PXX05_06590 [Legionella cardiaca]
MTPEELKQLIASHNKLKTTHNNLLGNFSKLNPLNFVCPPFPLKQKEFELNSPNIAIAADKAACAEVDGIKDSILELTRKNKHAEAMPLLEKLLEKLNYEVVALNQTSHAEYFSKTPKQITSIAEFHLFLSHLYRVEFSRRLNFSLHYALTGALFTCLEQFLPLDDKPSLMEPQKDYLRRRFAELRMVEADFAKALEEYKEIQVAVKEHLRDAQAILNEGEAKINFEAAVATLADKLNELHTKAKKDKNYKKASDAATILYDELQAARKGYFEDKNIGPIEFRKKCEDAVRLAHGELDNHRGCKNLLRDIGFYVISIATFGIALVVNRLVNQRYRFLAPVPTDSYQKLENFSEDFKQVEVFSHPNLR